MRPGAELPFHAQTLATTPAAVSWRGGQIPCADADAGRAAVAEGVTVTAGAGDATFSGAVGSINPLGALSVVSSHDFLEAAGIKAQSMSVNAINGVTNNGKLTDTGVVTVTARSDADGFGTLTI